MAQTTGSELTDATGALIVGGSANSWAARLGEIDPVELLEVQLVNVVAPFLLVDRLSRSLTAPGTHHRYVVNVTGREGCGTSWKPPSAGSVRTAPAPNGIRTPRSARRHSTC
ncbi:hypothetical protein ACQP2E_27665 [Actinoplanes sp. CA-015351]|uniref:hypothetical protein n=1 Tax=Actinoplanes sp. CA-015351 TaxID=3239897 RepID=UPI003D993017